MSVCTREFLSHPIDQPKHSLIEHLIAVGEKSKQLFAETSFKNQKIAFYSGLLHDVGKINPWYQEIFNATQDRKKIQEEVSEKFVQQHSVFSAWAAKYLLDEIGLDDDVIDRILVLIYGHHSTIRGSLGEIKQGLQFKASQEIMKESIKDFSSQVSSILEFSKLNWNSCVERFPRPVFFDLKLNSISVPDDFLEMSVAFSCLLQADRGSFKDWSVPKFSLSIDTVPLAKPKQMRDLSSSARIQQEKMGAMRNRFQKEVMENFDYSEKVIVIHAPTGIGKTKVFLDLISKYKDDKTIQRVFYFSPLLALTEDFERKFESTLEDKKQASDVLIYNHMFAESLEEKRKDGDEGYNHEWNFLIESFNKQFVITTTQRFLMTVYSNTAKEKLKMASFRNSILIIDEVQTIPKFILSNLKDIFQKMGQYMGTKIILVSATIPNEINEISKVKISKDLLDDYLDQTQKQIAIETLDLPTLIINKTLLMANTRKKAVNLYNSIAQIHKDQTKIYLSSGIRKKDRIDILENLSAKENYVLVSARYNVAADTMDPTLWIGPNATQDLTTYCGAAGIGTGPCTAGLSSMFGSRLVAGTSSGKNFQPGTDGLVQTYPTLSTFTLPLRAISVLEASGNVVLAAGTTATAENILVKFDSDTNTVSTLASRASANGEIEFYHVEPSSNGYALFDGLRFNDNTYVIGKINYSTGEVTILSTVTGKLDDFKAF